MITNFSNTQIEQIVNKLSSTQIKQLILDDIDLIYKLNIQQISSAYFKEIIEQHLSFFRTNKIIWNYLTNSQYIKVLQYIPKAIFYHKNFNLTVNNWTSILCYQYNKNFVNVIDKDKLKIPFTARNIDFILSYTPEYYDWFKKHPNYNTAEMFKALNTHPDFFIQKKFDFSIVNDKGNLSKFMSNKLKYHADKWKDYVNDETWEKYSKMIVENYFPYSEYLPNNYFQKEVKKNRNLMYKCMLNEKFFRKLEGNFQWDILTKSQIISVLLQNPLTHQFYNQWQDLKSSHLEKILPKYPHLIDKVDPSILTPAAIKKLKKKIQHDAIENMFIKYCFEEKI